MNEVFLKGNIGRDPELKYTQNNLAILEFSVATSRKKGQGFVTDWHRVVYFGDKAAEVSKYLRSGSKVFVKGTYNVEEYTAKDGSKKYSYKVSAYNVLPLMDMERPTGQQMAQSVSQDRDEWGDLM